MILETISIDWDKDTIESPLWFHKRGLMQTATGYGRKLATSKKYRYKNRLYRIYVCQYSNSGTAYILHKNQWVVLN